VPADNGDGMVIQHVTPGGPATKLKDSAGSEYFLEPGDIISAVNGHSSTTYKAYIQAMNTAPNKHHVPLDIIWGEDGSTDTLIADPIHVP
jgi:S1-C subfamily serine protease